MNVIHTEFTKKEGYKSRMIDEFSKYESRRTLVSDYYNLLGESILQKENGNYFAGNKMQEEAENLSLDLVRLGKTEEQDDFIQEAHLRFLARCRLVEIGDYILESFIGAGQCGAVYKGLRTTDKQPVAIKILFYPRNSEERTRFIEEGNITHKLDHEYLVSGCEPTQTVNGAPVYWYVMELIDNAASLKQYIDTQNIKSILQVLSKVCIGLEYLHSKDHVHRDLKGDNVFVRDTDTVKILDFGSITNSNHDYTFRPVGSLKICSPEKLMEPSSVGPATDMFSVGCILYYAVSGRWPFYGDNFGEKVELLRECNPPSLDNDSPELAELITKLLSKDASSRPVAKEAYEQLQRISKTL